MQENTNTNTNTNTFIPVCVDFPFSVSVLDFLFAQFRPPTAVGQSTPIHSAVQDFEAEQPVPTHVRLCSVCGSTLIWISML